MREASRAIALFGTDEPLPESVVLRAGPVSAEFENGALRYIRYHGVEVIRGIAYLYRDQNWATPSPEITHQRIEETGGGFRVTYDASINVGGQEYGYRAEIAGAADGALRFEVTGEARTELRANRIGFVVLHPLEGVAGEPVEVVHTDGTIERSRFPRLISPGQPFFDIRSLAHEVVPGVTAICTMEGDAYEMEDHRNWTDASYKTYIRPLSKPRPFTVPAGERLVQSVDLTFRGAPAQAVAPGSEGVTIRIGGEAGVMPRIGLGVPPDDAEAALEVADLIRTVRPGLLVGQLDLRDPAAGEQLSHLVTFTAAVGAPVALEIVLPNERTPEAELRDAAADVQSAGLQPEAVIPSPHEYLKSWQPNERWPDVPPLEAIYDAARAAFPGALIGGGALAYFTELNRKRPPADHIDFITHTTCPLVHDCDDRAVMDTLEALPWVAESVHAMAPGTPYRVGPSMLGMRQNPYGAAPADNPGNRRVAMALNDPRQQGVFGAAWNLGYVAHLARAGAEAITLSAPLGAFGIVYRRMHWPQPWFDRQGKGVYPLYHVLRGMAAAAGRARLETTSSNGAAVQAIAYTDAGRTVLWLANLTGAVQRIRLAGASAAEGEVARLDADSFAAASEGPEGVDRGARRERLEGLELGAFAVARVRIAR